MKVTIEIDCTPEEARTFFGQPDLKPLQEKVMARVEKQVLDSVTAMSPEAVLKMWSAFIPQSADQFREAFARLFGRSFGPSRPAEDR